MSRNAWVRPKPTPKPQRPATETLTPLLSYFSCNNHTRSSSPSKPKLKIPAQQTREKKSRQQLREVADAVVVDEYEDECFSDADDIYLQQRRKHIRAAKERKVSVSPPVRSSRLPVNSRGGRAKNLESFGRRELRELESAPRSQPRSGLRSARAMESERYRGGRRPQEREASDWDWAITPLTSLRV